MITLSITHSVRYQYSLKKEISGNVLLVHVHIHYQPHNTEYKGRLNLR